MEQQLESDQGVQDVGVQLALYFQRVAPTITNEYGILADPNLLEVAQTIFGLSPARSATNVDAQAKALSQLMPISDLQDPKKLQQPTERFTAMYDLTYGPAPARRLRSRCPPTTPARASQRPPPFSRA